MFRIILMDLSVTATVETAQQSFNEWVRLNNAGVTGDVREKPGPMATGGLQRSFVLEADWTNDKLPEIRRELVTQLASRLQKATGAKKAIMRHYAHEE